MLTRQFIQAMIKHLDNNKLRQHFYASIGDRNSIK